MELAGSHISALLLRMFVMYFPQMIEAGMVYKAIPPLFSIKINGKNKYFTEQIDIIRYIQKIFLDNNKICTTKKEELSNKDVTVLLMTNVDYIYWLEKTANTYAVDANLLEMVLYHYIENKDSINLSKLKKEIESKYRFMGVSKEKDTIVVSGVIEKSNLIILSEKFFKDCFQIIDIMKNNKYLYYNLNGKKSTIYEIMNSYNNYSPSKIQRYKGLGEMPKEQLAESTLYPGSDRTLVRYTLKDAKEEIEAIREYESNPKKILSHVGSVSREDLLD